MNTPFQCPYDLLLVVIVFVGFGCNPILTIVAADQEYTDTQGDSESSADTNTQIQTDTDTSSETPTDTDTTTENSDSDSDSQITIPEDSPCPEGSTISALTPDAGFARYGTVFSSTLYEPSLTDINNTHNPVPIEIQVTDTQGMPVSDCRVFWTPGDGSGWVFPNSETTDQEGKISAWWTAGSEATQFVQAAIYTADNQIREASITGSADPHETAPASMYLDYVLEGEYDGFKIELTPITSPPTTTYAAWYYNAGYFGLQNRATSDPPSIEDKWVIFTLWDSLEGATQIVDAADSTCTPFEGDDTGIRCNLVYDWQEGNTYGFELLIEPVSATQMNYTLYFEDLNTPDSKKQIATLGYVDTYLPSWATTYIDTWWHKGDSCLDTPARIASVHKPAVRNNEQWISIYEAEVDRRYVPTGNSICANYFYSVENNGFRLSTGGSSEVGPPILGVDDFPSLVLE